MAGQSVCVVGAGVSGLATIKECKHVGLDPICFELHSDLGGVWTLDRDSETSNTPRAWDSLITNTSKYVMTFSDFQPVPDTPQYMTLAEGGSYYRKYADHFRLKDHIRFNTRVVKIRKTSDHTHTGRWEVYTCPTSDFHGGDKRAGLDVTQEDLKHCTKHIFDKVIVCSGFFKIPKYPEIPGLDSFSGLVTHSFDYKSAEPFKDKKVLVVGNTFSAGDIANDISFFNPEPVHMSVGKGTWIVPRVLPGGLATDRGLSRDLLYNAKPADVEKMLVQLSQDRLDIVGSNFNPQGPPNRTAYMMGDDIYLKILTGKIRVVDQLVRFNGSTAEFKSGFKLLDVEAVVFATGYAKDASFIEMDVVRNDGKLSLYNMMLPIQEKHHSLAFVGFIAGDTPVPAVSELQARYVSRLITGKIQPPSKDVMEKNVQMLDNISLEKRGNYSYTLPLFVIGDNIAKDLGAYPSFWQILRRDPTLAYRVWYGPIFSAQYRLLGPDSNWETARAVCYRAQQVLTAVEGPKGLVDTSASQSGNRRNIYLATGGLAVAAVAILAVRYRAVEGFQLSDILSTIGINNSM